MSSFIGQNPTFFSQQLVMKYYHEMIETWMKNHLVSDNNYNIVNL